MRKRPSDAEFEELKRKRDEATQSWVLAFCAREGLDPEKTSFHSSHTGGCYCACPDGPCQHIWDGPDETDGNSVSVTCSLCGANCMWHDIRCAP